MKKGLRPVPLAALKQCYISRYDELMSAGVEGFGCWRCVTGHAHLGRRPKAAKERTRGRWCAEVAGRSAMGIWLMGRSAAVERGDMSCCALRAVLVSTTPSSPRPPAAPFVSSCSRSARSCASASAASRSRWRRAVRPRRSGGSLPPPRRRRKGSRLAGMTRAAAARPLRGTNQQPPTETRKTHLRTRALRRHEPP